jgi:hypothetical protein
VDGPDHAESPDALFGRILRWMALAGGWIIVALMIYTVLDVIPRQRRGA